MAKETISSNCKIFKWHIKIFLRSTLKMLKCFKNKKQKLDDNAISNTEAKN